MSDDNNNPFRTVADVLRPRPNSAPPASGNKAPASYLQAFISQATRRPAGPYVTPDVEKGTGSSAEERRPSRAARPRTASPTRSAPRSTARTAAPASEAKPAETPVNSAAITAEQAMEKLKFTSEEQKAAFKNAYLPAKNAAYASAMQFKDVTPDVLKNLAKGLPQDFQDILAKEIDAAKASPTNLAQINARIMGYMAGIKAVEAMAPKAEAAPVEAPAAAHKLVGLEDDVDISLDRFGYGLGRSSKGLAEFLSRDFSPENFLYFADRTGHPSNLVRFNKEGDHFAPHMVTSAEYLRNPALNASYSIEGMASLIAQQNQFGADNHTTDGRPAVAVGIGGNFYPHVLERTRVNNFNLNPKIAPSKEKLAAQLNELPLETDVRFTTYTPGGTIITHSYQRNNLGQFEQAGGKEALTADELAKRMIDRVNMTTNPMAKSNGPLINSSLSSQKWTANKFNGAPNKDGDYGARVNFLGAGNKKTGLDVAAHIKNHYEHGGRLVVKGASQNDLRVEAGGNKPTPDAKPTSTLEEGGLAQQRNADMFKPA